MGTNSRSNDDVLRILKAEKDKLKTEKKQEKGLSEVAHNQLWREAIRKEIMLTRNPKTEYACNLHLLQRDRVTEKPGIQESNIVLTADENSKRLTSPFLAHVSLNRRS